jgi:hypothetical protein
MGRALCGIEGGKAVHRDRILEIVANMALAH